jgi:glyoxylase-like metal-dependent hydrolase (beta-lactamase superfamily II)
VADTEPIWRIRPAAEAMAPASALQAELLAPGIWCSPGLTNAYLLTTADGRVVINTGMGFEAAVHRANFDAVDPGPVRYIVITQGHYDHVGGIDTLRDPLTKVVAQANWRTWRDDNERLMTYRAARSAFAFQARLADGVAAIRRRFGSLPPQSTLTADIEVGESLTLQVGQRRIELIATPGGETTDSMVVWLPDERVCLCSNTFGPVFGHIPNLVTIRGDRYRDALTVIDTIERVRALQPETLITGHFDPIRGAGRIDAELRRLRDAVSYVHDHTVAGMNAGKDVWTLMAEITLPPDLAVGQGYGRVAWDVRAIWENYSGWFHHRSTTELYPVGPDSVSPDVVELAGADALIARARAHLDSGRPLQAIHLAEIVLHTDAADPGCRAVLKDAHTALLADSVNFWESAWLTAAITRYS